MTSSPGYLMASESAEAPKRFVQAISQDLSADIAPLAERDLTAIYTIARGSSDAAANILSYEAMSVLARPRPKQQI